MTASKNGLVAFAAIASLCSTSFHPAVAQVGAENKVPAVFECGAFSTDHSLRPFSQTVDVMLSRGRLAVERRTGRRPGVERLEGSVTKNGAIELSGKGEYSDHSGGWTVKLNGRLGGRQGTDLTGILRGGYGKGHGYRKCHLAFLVSSPELRMRLSAFFELEQRQDDLEQRQATVEEKTNETSNRLDKLTHALDFVVGKIVLPTSEDPKHWILNIAAVPVQQQQFCKIVDRFHDDLGQVRQTRNDLRINAMYRDRQKDIAALLPGGRFENWVVALKEVKQESDGSIQVLLQPPCRVVLASNACEKPPASLTGSIKLGSPMARELEKLAANEFVVISGRLYYAAQTLPDQPQPIHALYEPGAYCSTLEAGKAEEVLVTEITYLAALR